MEHNLYQKYENVMIRPLLKEDLELLRIWRNDPRNTVYLSQIPHITHEMQLQWYKKSLYNEEEVVFAIEEISKLNRIVGSLAIYNFNSQKAEIGKIMVGDSEAHGNKVGLNSLLAALKVCFNHFKLREVYLHVYADNIPAIKIYKEAGFLVDKVYNTKMGIEYVMSKKNNNNNM